MRPNPITRLACLAVLVASTALGQTLKAAKEFPSTPDKAVGVVIGEKAGGWLVFASPAMTPAETLAINDGAGIVWEGRPGAYLVFFFPAGQSIPQPLVTVKTLGIAGPVTPQPPVVDPDPPAPAAELVGPAYLIVIRKNEDLTANQVLTLADLRAWSDARADIEHQEFSPDAADPAVASYAAKIPAGTPQPWAFVARSRKDGRGAKVLWCGTLPTRSEEITKRLEEALK